MTQKILLISEEQLAFIEAAFLCVACTTITLQPFEAFGF